MNTAVWIVIVGWLPVSLVVGLFFGRFATVGQS
jgi:hypothetical protein